MENGEQIMRDRILRERKEELKKKFKKDKKYIIHLSSKFIGNFSHFEEESGVVFVVFTTEGVTDCGSIPFRRFELSRIVDSELIKT